MHSFSNNNKSKCYCIRLETVSFVHLIFKYGFSRFVFASTFQSQSLIGKAGILIWHWLWQLTKLSFVKADSFLYILCQLFLWIGFYAPSVGCVHFLDRHSCGHNFGHIFCKSNLAVCVKLFSEWTVESPGPSLKGEGGPWGERKLN